jgi:hypothetical protein
MTAAHVLDENLVLTFSPLFTLAAKPWANQMTWIHFECIAVIRRQLK